MCISVPLKNDELDIVEAEFDKRLKKQIICESKSERNDYLSSIFTRNKKDGGKRMIFKSKTIQYPHNVYLASIDLKDVFTPSQYIHNVKNI